MDLPRLCRALLLLSIPLLLACTVVMAQGYPHAVFGTVSSSDGSAVVGASVQVENLRTSESLTDTTDSLGRFQVDLASMPSGYQDGDNIRVSAQLDDTSSSRTVTVSGPNNECNLTFDDGGNGQVPSLGVAGIVITFLLIAPLVTLFRRSGR